MIIILLIILLVFIAYILYKNKKPKNTITIESTILVNGVPQPSKPKIYPPKKIKFKLYPSNESYNKDKILKQFVANWSDAKSDIPEYFISNPTEDEILEVFNLLDSEYILYYHILNDTDEITLEKFKEVCPKIIRSESEKERLEALEDFIDEWMNVELSDREFKKKPNKTQCTAVFEELEKKYSCKEIISETDFVLDKFIEMYPNITNTIEERDTLLDLEYFLEDCKTWSGPLGGIKHKLAKKPTKSQLKEVFYALIADGVKSTRVYEEETLILKKLISLYPELKKT